MDWFNGLLKLDEDHSGDRQDRGSALAELRHGGSTFRIAGGLKLGFRAFPEGVVLAGVGTTVLKFFSIELLARSGNNPVLASFAIIIGLLIRFNLVSQV